MGHNLFSDQPAVPLAPTDLINTDPMLGPLGDNGGPTETQALLPGSPAIDAGVAVPGVTTDQRGVPRPQGQAPDIGAFESRSASLLTTDYGATSRSAARHVTATLIVSGSASPLRAVPVAFQVTFRPE